MKPIWKGSISFGLINIPVSMYTATREHALDLDMLRKGDHCPIHFKRVCALDGQEVPYADIVKGYKLASGKYVILDAEDVESMESIQTHTMDISRFVRSEEVDMTYFDRPYYLEPAPGGEKAYTLLHAAISESERVALASVVVRTREQIGLLAARGPVIIYNRMRYPDEILSPQELNLPRGLKITPKEHTLALDLVKQLTEEFDPSALKDTYKAKLERYIKAKEHHHEVTHVTEPKATHVDELLSELENSLAKLHHARSASHH